MNFRLVSFFVSHVARLIARTLRLRVIGEDRMADYQRQGKGVILVTWHGRTFVPIIRFRNLGYWAIISTSRDGEYQNQIFHRFGWHTVRDSTSARGAAQAALAMVRHLNNRATLAFTPDGPCGPSHQVQPGSIFLAQNSGCPIIPAGISAVPRCLMQTWEHWAEQIGKAIDALDAECVVSVRSQVAVTGNANLWHRA
jgi:lysophospholipid acyltransferase (LPLAT)-like uncharacterized protein